MLRSLEISGFKSFGKKTALEFMTPITAIVGPNGSGKSNVAEAFQFVLGEQSLKSMRGKKGEDLIFNGGKTAPRANRASVKVVFDNSKRILNIDFDEVTIERVVHRDGVNEYLINGSAVRLKDIVEILAAAHIGPSGHHIISQGEADRILNANIKDRREIVEEALGLKIYQYKKQESERKLEKTEENISQVESLRKEIAPHLRFLKKQVEKLERAEELKRELVSLYQDYFAREYFHISSNKKRLAEAKQGPHEKIRVLEQELAEATRVLNEASHKDARSADIIFLEKQIGEIREKKDTLSRDIGRIEGEIGWQERVLKKERDGGANDGGKTIPLAEVEGLKKMIDDEANRADSAPDLPAVQEIVRRIRSLFERFVTERKTVSNASVITEYENALAVLREKKTSFESELAVVRDEERSCNERLAGLKQAIEQEKAGTMEAEKAIFRIMAEQQEVHSRLSLIKGDEERLRLEEEDYKRELHEAAVLVGREGINFSENAFFEAEERALQLDRRKMIEKIKIRLEESGIAGGADIMKEYKEVEARSAFLEKEIIDLEASAENLKTLIGELEERIGNEFREGIYKINAEFQRFFALMFGGGHASLEVAKPERRRRSEAEDILLAGEGITLPDEDVDEKVEEGVDIHVSLPHKKIKGLTMLSGGERALTSIALLFAMSQVNPPPFIILDETDAALDEANSRKYGDMIANLSTLSQLILITHNRETMSRAGVLYGVTMGSDGISKLLSIAFEEAVVVAK